MKILKSEVMILKIAEVFINRIIGLTMLLYKHLQHIQKPKGPKIFLSNFCT